METLNKIDEALGVLNEANALKKLESKSVKIAKSINKDIDKFINFIADYNVTLGGVDGMGSVQNSLTEAKESVDDSVYKLQRVLKDMGYEVPADKPTKTKASKKHSIFKGIGFK